MTRLEANTVFAVAIVAALVRRDDAYAAAGSIQMADYAAANAGPTDVADAAYKAADSRRDETRAAADAAYKDAERAARAERDAAVIVG